ncbi:hypothetical protein FI667_g16676, partial [Globisporangium splendens]
MPGSHYGGERSSEFFSSTVSNSPPTSSRRKSIWKSEPRVPKLKIKRHQQQHAPRDLNSNNSHFHNGGMMEKKKKEGSFLDALFPKRKNSSAHSLLHPNSSMSSLIAAKRKLATNPAAIARGVEILKSIFPKWDTEPLQALLEINEYVMEDTISAILKMEAADASTNEASKEAATGATTMTDFPIKNPLPEDFLRLPDDDSEDDQNEDDDDEEEEEEDVEREEQDGDEKELEAKAVHVVKDDSDDDNVSEKSSTLAEDDGTLYGKEFSVDGEDMKEEECAPPVFNGAAQLANDKLVVDSMNQKFIPEELRNEPSSIFDTAHIDVIKRSKLNLNEAENRIRHREPHLVFELLSKASEIYRDGLISSHELDLLRSMIVTRIQPSKMLMDMTMNMDGIISDHEWHLLILKAKERRNSHIVVPQEYMIRVVDVESGVVWFTRKRFREFYKLHRKLCRLSGRVNACEFPTRRTERKSANSLATDRAPILETFLRTTAALVTPSPLTFLHGVALKQLQQFLDVPHVGLLERNRTQPIPRELRVYVYHTVNDITSPEGKACAKFLAKMKQYGVDPGKNMLEELGDILDGVQEYMLEHRFEEMKTHVQRLIKYFGTAEQSHNAGGRSSSFVNLNTTDVLSNNDKMQQMISDAIRHELEERICIPLMLDLNAYLRGRVMHKEQQFRQRVFQLKGKPQSYFGIPIDKISLSSWRSVVDTIKEIDDAFLPLDKMRKLVATAHSIHTLYKAERQIYRASLPPRHSRRHSISFSMPPVSTPSRVSSDFQLHESSTVELDRDPSFHEEEETTATVAAAEDHDDVLSGDDFLPIFVYVIVHSDLETPIMTQVLLNRLCDPEKRRSESGYYLATFEAALHHILSRDIFDAEHE